MRVVAIIAINALLLTTHAVAQPATAPSTAPATDAPREIFLAEGKLVFTAPPELNFLGKRDDDRSAGFSFRDNQGLVTILVTPQQHPFPKSAVPELVKLLTRTIQQEAQRGEMDIVMPPRVVSDPRFLVVVHDRFNMEQRFGDRKQMYRAIGLYLCCVVATGFTEDEAEAQRVHELGAQMLASLQLHRPGAARRVATPGTPATRPVAFENARIRVIPPLDWTSEANEHARSGIIVTFRDPEDPTNLIAVSTRPLPREALRDPKLRDIAVDEIVAGEKQSFQIEGAELIGQTQTMTDRRFLRKTRSDYTHDAARFRITSRQVRAGDVVVSVTMVAMETRADEIDAIADRVALDIRAMPGR